MVYVLHACAFDFMFLMWDPTNMADKLSLHKKHFEHWLCAAKFPNNVSPPAGILDPRDVQLNPAHGIQLQRLWGLEGRAGECWLGSLQQCVVECDQMVLWMDRLEDCNHFFGRVSVYFLGGNNIVVQLFPCMWQDTMVIGETSDIFRSMAWDYCPNNRFIRKRLQGHRRFWADEASYTEQRRFDACCSRYPLVIQHSYWTLPIYSEFSNLRLWFSIAMLNYQRVLKGGNSFLSFQDHFMFFCPDPEACADEDVFAEKPPMQKTCSCSPDIETVKSIDSWSWPPQQIIYKWSVTAKAHRSIECNRNLWKKMPCKALLTGNDMLRKQTLVRMCVMTHGHVWEPSIQNPEHGPVAPSKAKKSWQTFSFEVHWVFQLGSARRTPGGWREKLPEDFPLTSKYPFRPCLNFKKPTWIYLKYMMYLNHYQSFPQAVS